MKQRAVFLDRDGVINRDRASYVKSWAEVKFLPGALPALARLARFDFAVVIISNQSAIGRGLVAQQIVDEIHARMVEAIAEAGGRIDLVLYCPHRPDEGCSCRKPQAGMIFRAAQALDLDIIGSYFVGDAATDIMAAQTAGCLPILVKTGRGSEQLGSIGDTDLAGFYVAADLSGAVDWIIGRAAIESGGPR